MAKGFEKWERVGSMESKAPCSRESQGYFMYVWAPKRGKALAYAVLKKQIQRNFDICGIWLFWLVWAACPIQGVITCQLQGHNWLDPDLPV